MGNMFLGVLSGTSLDAINIGAFNFTTDFLITHANLAHAASYPIPQYIKTACLQLMEGKACQLEQLGSLDNQLGLLFAEAILTFLADYDLKPSTISAIGYHGQTIHHKPAIEHPFTMQIGDPNIISAKTGIITVADFRRKDMAVGGQGAPLAPAFHAAIFRNKQATRTIINIGGISNISFLDKDQAKPIIGFDTGPGNCLLDLWAEKHFNLKYDINGKLAKSGQVINVLLTSMLMDPYFHLPTPKSTGREYFNLDWIEKHLQLSDIPITYSPKDILATLVKLTSKTISDAILACDPLTEIYVCGGGVYNQTLMTSLQEDLAREIYTTAALGIAPEWVETGLFAWLAQQRLLGQPGNVPNVTGANKAVVLGGVY